MVEEKVSDITVIYIVITERYLYRFKKSLLSLSCIGLSLHNRKVCLSVGVVTKVNGCQTSTDVLEMEVDSGHTIQNQCT